MHRTAALAPPPPPPPPPRLRSLLRHRCRRPRDSRRRPRPSLAWRACPAPGAPGPGRHAAAHEGRLVTGARTILAAVAFALPPPIADGTHCALVPAGPAAERRKPVRLRFRSGESPPLPPVVTPPPGRANFAGPPVPPSAGFPRSPPPRGTYTPRVPRRRRAVRCPLRAWFCRNSTPVAPFATTAMLDAPAAEPRRGGSRSALRVDLEIHEERARQARQRQRGRPASMARGRACPVYDQSAHANPPYTFTLSRVGGDGNRLVVGPCAYVDALGRRAALRHRQRDARVESTSAATLASRRRSPFPSARRTLRTSRLRGTARPSARASYCTRRGRPPRSPRPGAAGRSRLARSAVRGRHDDSVECRPRSWRRGARRRVCRCRCLRRFRSSSRRIRTRAPPRAAP